MKVISSQQMSAIESLAYRDGSSEVDFMEEAGSGVALVVNDFAETFELHPQIVLLCGKGNNAGDAYLAGLHLLHLDYDVIAYQLFPTESCSKLCQDAQTRFLEDGGQILDLDDIDDLQFSDFCIIVDGIFGTGFRGAVQEPIASVIRKANESNMPIVAVDIPSGLNGDNGSVEGEAILATITAFLGLPKTGFFLADGWNHVGKLVYVDYGLPLQYIEASDADMIMLSPDIMSPMMPKIVRNRNKYEAGYVIGLAGSKQFPGAALLASTSALKGGAGIVKLYYPEGMESELVNSPYELIKVPYSYKESLAETFNKATALFIGPGIGLSEETRKMVTALLPKLSRPCVIDADALTIISEKKCKLPQEVILTPHLGELKRLMKLKEIELDLDFLMKCKHYAESENITLILKGGPSFIFHPGEPIYVCANGDPGMATAGSGDVLTGLIASLLSQGLTTHQAALLGVYLHALAGEFAAEELSSYCLVASDLISFFSEAFLFDNSRYV